MQNSYATDTCPNCDHPMMLQNNVDQYCEHCTTTLVAIGTIDLSGYKCNTATMTEIVTAIVGDLAAHGFTNLVIKPFPHNPGDRRLIIWGQHVDRSITARIADIKYREQLYVYWYQNGEILRDGDGIVIASYPDINYNRNAYEFNAIYGDVHRWMRSQDTHDVRNEPTIYKTSTYYQFQRNSIRNQKKLGRSSALKAIQERVTSIAYQIDRIDNMIAEYNETFHESLPVEYTEVRLPNVSTTHD